LHRSLVDALAQIAIGLLGCSERGLVEAGEVAAERAVEPVGALEHRLGERHAGQFTAAQRNGRVAHGQWDARHVTPPRRSSGSGAPTVVRRPRHWFRPSWLTSSAVDATSLRMAAG